MRILFCNYEYPPLGGGGGVVNASLAEELATRHEVTILSSQGLGLPEISEANSVRIIRVPVYFRRRLAAANFPSMLTYLPAGMKRGRKLLSAESFDVINTHFALPSGPVGQHLADFANIPNVLSVHGGDLYDPSKRSSPHRYALLRAWIRQLLRRADCVVGQSRNTLQNMRNFYAPEISGTRIPLGIKRPPPVSATRGEFGFAADDRVLVTVGRLVSRKAVDQLIGMIQSLGDPRLHLVIVGSGPLEEALHRQAIDAQVQANIHFMGQADELVKLKLLSIADAFVSTSQHEGFGLVYLEAMAAGLPVICYDHGGQTDFLDDSKTGGLIPLNDHERFLHSVKQLMADSNLCTSIGKENLRLVEEFYIDTCATRYEQLFQQVIERRSPVSPSRARENKR
jgi:glycosyltransferase involved in cell wall biosynthesis